MVIVNDAPYVVPGGLNGDYLLDGAHVFDDAALDTVLGDGDLDWEIPA